MIFPLPNMFRHYDMLRERGNMMKRFMLIAVVFLILTGCKQNVVVENQNMEDVYFTQEKYFPTNEWRKSTPEAQGMDTEKLMGF